MLRRAWLMGGIDPVFELDSNTLQKLGINSFAALQIRFAWELQKSKNMSDRNKARKNFVAQCIEVLELNQNSSNALFVSKDFLFSLTRAAYHAYYMKDFVNMHELIEVYFGKKHSKIENRNLKEARKQISLTGAPNRQWMILLDICTSGLARRNRSELHVYNKLLEGHNLANATLTRTIPFLAERLGKDPRRIINEPHYKKWSRLVQMTMHKAYFHAIADESFKNSDLRGK